MKILFVSLGCDKNLVDSQQMMGLLKGTSGDYSFTDDESEAEVAIVNTCAFIDSAKEESIGNILDLAKLKTAGRLKALVVTGCMAQRYQDEITRDIPEVDAVLGTTAEHRLGEVLDGILAGRKPDGAIIEDATKTPNADTEQVITLGSSVGYLKIAEGCDKHCSYCVIPSMRGHYRSVPMEKLTEQAKRLAASGVTELILVAEETTLYGVDLYGEKKLPELIRRLCLLSGIRWIRILYCYPEEITKDLIQVMKEEPKIVHYLDMPIQHASDRILRLMGRRTNRKELEGIIAYIRHEIPDICLRTTLITGFPTETEEDVETVKSFIRTCRFDRLGVFTYSREEGTPAAKMSPQVHWATKKRRQKELMLLQQDIAFEAARAMVGRVLDVVIEGRMTGETGEHGGDVYVGRTYRDIPDVDSSIFIETRRDLMSGSYVRVRVTGANAYDLTGEIEDGQEDMESAE
ncbi:ribosomal protein S12 methylthiotransferase [Lachnospiraceae bacterium NK3A20]|nr:ribosomal protein S12 methylthiotransferase [Lachnospiraceae bacterium NK3A20]